MPRRRAPRDRAEQRDPHSGSVALSPRRVEHEQRLQEGERRLGSLVDVDRRLAQPVVAATGGEVVDRGVQPVAAEEPLEGADRPASRGLRAGGPKGLGLCLDQRRRVQRLLIAGARVSGSLLAVVMADVAGERGVDPYLARVPIERAQALAEQLVVAEARARRDQRLGQASVVVGQQVLGPVPVVRRVGTLLVGQPLGQVAQHLRRPPRPAARGRRAPGRGWRRPSCAGTVAAPARATISSSRMRLGSSTAVGGSAPPPRPAPRRRARDGRRRVARRASAGRRT